MPKTPVKWQFRELLTSSKHSQQTTDYLTPGLPVLHVMGQAGEFEMIGATFGLMITGYLGFYPWNPAKTPFDRMRINFRFLYDMSVGNRPVFAYSLDAANVVSGAGNLGVPTAPAPPTKVVAGYESYTFIRRAEWIAFPWGYLAGPPFTHSVTAGFGGYQIIDLSGYEMDEELWMSWAIAERAASNTIWCGWWCDVFLYNSIDNPF